MDERKKQISLILTIPFWTFLLIFPIWCGTRHSEVGTKESNQKLLEIKNTITGEFLKNCKIKTSNCDFDLEHADMNELAGYIRNARPVYATGHSVPYVEISFKENKNDEYFTIRICFFNKLKSYGVAILDCILYKGEKHLASKYFSSPELTDWSVRYFPKVFDKIQKENEKSFYMDIKNE